MRLSRNCFALVLLCASSSFAESIAGRVANSTTNEAIPSTTVELTCLTETAQPNVRPDTCKDTSVKTLDDGTFHFDRLPPGQYRLAATPSAGFAATKLSQVETIVDSRHAAGEVVLKLSPESTISGKVLDELGQPKPAVAVEAFRVVTSATGSSLRNVSKSTTNQDGVFTLHSLMSGNYYIGTPLQHEDSNDPTRPYLFFAPSASGFDQATVVHVEAAQNYSDIEIHLRPVSFFKIQGRAQMDAVSSVASDKPQLLLDQRDASGVSAPDRKILLNSDGTFQTEVLPGAYTLTLEGALALSQPANSRRASASQFHILAKQDIEVTGKDLLGVTVLIPPPITVTGHAVLEGTTVSAVGKGRVRIKPAEPSSIAASQIADIQPDGTFTFSNCDPVKYSVGVSPPSGTYVQSIVFNQQDIGTQFMDLSKGSGGELSVTVRKGLATVTGSVADASSTPEGSLLFDIAFIPDLWVPNGLAYVHHVQSRNERFSAANLPPGHYAVVATTSVDSRSWEIPSLVHALAERGIAIELAENDQKSLTVPYVTLAEINDLRTRLGLD